MYIAYLIIHCKTLHLSLWESDWENFITEERGKENSYFHRCAPRSTSNARRELAGIRILRMLLFPPKVFGVAYTTDLLSSMFLAITKLMMTIKKKKKNTLKIFAKIQTWLNWYNFKKQSCDNPVGFHFKVWSLYFDRPMLVLFKNVF